MNLLALDVGTSSVKAAVLDQKTGDPLAKPAKGAYPLEHPTPDAAEVSPEKLWAAIVAASALGLVAVGLVSAADVLLTQGRYRGAAT